MLKNVAGGLISNLNQRKNMNTEITLPASELKAALPGLSKVVSRKSGLPVLQNIKVSRQRNGLVTFCLLYTSGTGTYVLNLAQMPEPFVVSSGDQGGGMTGSASYAGTITLGDQDIWAFTACTGDAINLGLKTTNFLGYLELYGPNGAPLESVGDLSLIHI